MDDRLFFDDLVNMASVNRLINGAGEKIDVYSRKNVTTFKRPKKESSTTISRHLQLADTVRFNHLRRNLWSFRSSVITLKQHSSAKDLNELEPITLSEMSVNQTHFGRYLECKTIAEPYYVMGLHVIVEDQSGDIENVTLYYFNSKSYDENPNDLLPNGTRIIIKEPCLLQSVCFSGGVYIRVDSPTNVIVLEDDCLTNNKKSVDQLIEEGNSHFKEAKYHSSISLYTQALKKSNEINLRAVLNRAMSYLRLEQYNLAFKDAKCAAELDGCNEKAHFRVGKAAYAMQKYEKAKDHFETCLRVNSKNEDAKKELDRSCARINEINGNLFRVYYFSNLYPKGKQFE
jgi:tetratricopeptide (TPR) repeat protein